MTEPNTPHPTEPLERLDLHFNYEPGALRRAGIDPSTSEGKAFIKQVLLDALAGTKSPMTFERLVVHSSLLSEGP